MSNYAVSECYHTIQGEGVQAGTPMVFLRLQGCSVSCGFCDTRYSWVQDEAQRRNSLADLLDFKGEGIPPADKAPAWCEATALDIARTIVSRWPEAKWVVITGGEPAEQDLYQLAEALHRQQFLVALETSGTALGHLRAHFDWITCSPKWAMQGGKDVLPQAVAPAHEIKMVVRSQADIDRLTAFLREHRLDLRSDVQICLQPVSLSEKATALCIEVCKKHGWRLSLQLHRYLKVA